MQTKSEQALVADMIDAVAKAATAIRNASAKERAEFHPDLLAKADEIAEMLDLANAA